MHTGVAHLEEVRWTNYRGSTEPGLTHREAYMKGGSYIDKPDVFWVSNTTGSILTTGLTFTTKKLPSTSDAAKMMSMPNISHPHLCTR